jgi:hypothetical protein
MYRTTKHFNLLMDVNPIISPVRFEQQITETIFGLVK